MAIATVKRISNRKSGRPTARRPFRRRFLIVAGGRETEPSYIETLKQDLHRDMGGTVVVKCAAKDPLSLVSYASRLMDIDRKDAAKDSFDPYDKVWVLTDCDDYKCIESAVASAKKAGIELIVSNPCFEVWLIDHVEPCPPYCSDTKSCERHAIGLGLLASSDSGRKSAGRQKVVVADMVSGRATAAIKNASRHNDAEKALSRERNPGNTAHYAVWTDMPTVVGCLLDESSRLEQE